MKEQAATAPLPHVATRSFLAYKSVLAFTGFFTCRDMGPQPVKGLATRIEFRCSPYHQNSTFYPLIEHLQRVLQFTVGETPQEKLGKLEQTLAVTIFT